MISFSKAILSIYTLFFLACHAINAMEYPQLQLANPKEQLTLINCEAIIGKRFGIIYGLESAHNDILQRHNLQSTMKDPLVPLEIRHNSQLLTLLRIPLKYCINLDDNSKLQITDLYSKHLINAQCKKNPESSKNFAEKITECKNEFYKDPGIFIASTRCSSEYIDNVKFQIEKAGIAIKDNSSWVIKYNHGPNGCNSDEKVWQSIIEEKIPQNISYFKALKQRELTGSFKK